MCPVGVEVFHVDRRTNARADEQTDMTKLPLTFRNFANAPKKATKLKTVINNIGWHRPVV